jgi:hypothetical protein
MKNFTFLKDLFSESKGGKYSSKKFWGHIFMLLVAAAFIVDGLHFYTVNVDLFNTMVIAGTTLIGLRTIRTFFERKSAEPAKPASDEQK